MQSSLRQSVYIATIKIRTANIYIVSMYQVLFLGLYI